MESSLAGCAYLRMLSLELWAEGSAVKLQAAEG